ncbi:MAG: cupin domain-containing protein [Terriglobia bacterium]
MRAFDMDELRKQCDPGRAASAEFFRVPAMSLSVYCIPAGAPDPQQPHTEDEAYYVVRGRAVFRAGNDERAVGPGTVLFVEAGVAHRFQSIAEDLVLLVVFAPAKGSRAA